MTPAPISGQAAPRRQQPSAARRPVPASPTGGAPLPAPLRHALEHLSGLTLGDVRVHRRSPLPPLLGARAFAYGVHIHLAAGAEDALAHEAWHVVQQKQGRVHATGRVNGLPLNDDPALEAEAEAMGAEADRLARGPRLVACSGLRRGRGAAPVIQRVLQVADERYTPQRLAECQTEIGQRFQLDARNVPEFTRIVTDLIDESWVCDTWPELEKEIRIRRVGYAAVRELERLLAVHRPAYTRAMAQLAEWEQTHRALYEADQLRDESLRTHYRDDDAYRAARKQESDRLTGSIVTWGNPSYTSEKFISPVVVEREMFRWLTGARAAAPLVMNCWELVTYGLVLSGLVDRSYVAWCNAAYPRRHPALANTKGFLNLSGEVLSIMDCNFVCTAEAERTANKNTFMTDASKRIPQPAYYTSAEALCVDPTLVIPRGRILMFNAGEHFAISTGRRGFIRSDAAIQRVKRKVGHGMIQLDGGTGTIEESTIEDLAGRYLRSLVVAPFPICPAQTLDVSKSFPRTEEEREELRRQFSVTVERDKNQAITDANTALEQQLLSIEATFDPDNAVKSRRVVDQKKATAKARAQKNLEAIEKNAAKQLTDMVIAFESDHPRTLTYQFVIRANDPYAGAVQF